MLNRQNIFLLLLFIAIMSYIVYMNVTVSVRHGSRYSSVKVVNDAVYSALSADFNMSLPKEVVIENMADGGFQKISIYAKIILNKSIVDDFKKNIHFKTVRAQDGTIEGICLKSIPLIKVLPWWNITMENIDYIDQSENNRTSIIYMKEKDGKIAVFLMTDDGGVTKSFATSKLLQ